MDKLIGIVVLGALLMAGCSKLTIANYSQVKVGMDYGEVRSLLGEPTACSDLLGARSCFWTEGERSVAIQFVGEKVVLYSANNLR